MKQRRGSISRPVSKSFSTDWIVLAAAIAGLVFAAFQLVGSDADDLAVSTDAFLSRHGTTMLGVEDALKTDTD